MPSSPLQQQAFRIIIGTRGSTLALKQCAIVKEALLAIDSTLAIEVKIITTQGDTDQRPIPLDQIGKGWFSKEIEQGLQDGSISIAVHSLKDLPEKLAAGLVIAAIMEREDARDVLVLKKHKSLAELPAGAVIGTDSTRRRVQLLALRPDISVESMRGNVPTRIQKLKEGDKGREYDGIMLAAAGLNRLGLQDEITEFLEVDEVTPAPGQGALAIEIKADNTSLAALVARINHAPTDREVRAERAFSMAVGGGCKQPVGAYAVIKEDPAGSGKQVVHLKGMIGTKGILRDEIVAPVFAPGSGQDSFGDSEKIGQLLAERMLATLNAQ